MRTSTLIARDIAVIATWFAVMLAFAAGCSVALAGIYDSLELSPMAATLTTMTLSMLAATAAAGLCWMGIDRALARRAAKAPVGAASTEAAIADIA